MNEGDENKGQMIAEEEGETGRRHNTRKNKKDMKGIYHPSLGDRVRATVGEREEKKTEKRKGQEERLSRLYQM